MNLKNHVSTVRALVRGSAPLGLICLDTLHEYFKRQFNNVYLYEEFLFDKTRGLTKTIYGKDSIRGIFRRRLKDYKAELSAEIKRQKAIYTIQHGRR